jgi:hypothetical protein
MGGFCCGAYLLGAPIYLCKRKIGTIYHGLGGIRQEKDVQECHGGIPVISMAIAGVGDHGATAIAVVDGLVCKFIACPCSA